MGPDYDEGKKQVQNYKQIASALKKKKVMLVVFEDETIVTQKPCIRKSMSFEGEQQKKLDITVVERNSQCTYPCYGLNRTCCMVSMTE